MAGEVKHEESCLAPGCIELVGFQIACTWHWNRLPEEFRQQIGRAGANADVKATTAAVLRARRWWARHPGR